MTIPNNFQESHEQVRSLVADFRAREAYYLSSAYQEAEARQDFIDKFWIALGWDVRHEHQKNPYEQEVKVERGVTVGLAQKRADYAFHLGPNYRDPRFFCEAKKPSVKIREDRDAHFQTQSYGYSAGAKLSVLFDFQELVIVDCRRQPHIDAALSAAHRSYGCGDFEDAEKFGEIYWLFSREAVGTGKLDAYVAALPKPRKTGKQPGLLRGGDTRAVDAAFLDDLEQYRADLAKMLKNRNAELDGDTLTELVQRILDRLVFLRFLEDKGIETECRVEDFARAAGGQGWERFLAASRKLDGRYNGVVFKRHDILDGGRLIVDAGDFAEVCEALLYVNNGCLFSYIPIHVLGSIYERFLGTVIVTTDKRARPELKPEVRKAGGVYYTPEYVVRYICEQTVGKLIAGKTPAQIEKMRFADIACGSGSFLLGVFDLLLRYHGRWYAEHSEAGKKENLAPATRNKKRRKDFIPAVVERNGLLCLTLEKKRQILLNNIYGVDLDPQAVEVAQLSLYLKLLEDETTASTRDDYLDFHEALLPSLSGNIKCGNSLVGQDILHGQFEFSAEAERKLRPMDFESVFPQVFAPKWSGADRVKDDADGFQVDVDFEFQHAVTYYPERSAVEIQTPKLKVVRGGFDAIVGNPPYLGGREWTEQLWNLRPYFQTQYSCMTDQYDLYALFIQRALSLTKTGGLLAYITPNTWLNNEHYENLREYLIRNSQVQKLGDFRDVKVFVDATVLPVVFVTQRNTAPNPYASTIIEAFTSETESVEFETSVSAWRTFPGNVFNLSLSAVDVPVLKRISKEGQELGLLAECRFGVKVYQRGKGKPPQTGVEATEQRYESDRKEGPNFHPYVWGEHVSRWKLSPTDTWLNYGPHLAEPRAIELFQGDRVLVRRIVADRLVVVPVTEMVIADQLLHTVKPISANTNAKYLAAILGSTLIAFYFRKRYNRTEKTFPEIRVAELASLPIRSLDLTKPDEKAQHDRLVQLVETMLKAKAQFSAVKTESARTYLEDKCAGLDRQIDQLVYDFYGLTSDEIALVEGTA